MHCIDFFNQEQVELFGFSFDRDIFKDKYSKEIRVFGKIEDGDCVILDHRKNYLGYSIDHILKTNKKVYVIADEKAFVPSGVKVIRTKNIDFLIDELIKYKRKKYSGVVVGVTGSVGKTSTTNLINNALSLYGSTKKSVKHNLKNGIYSNLNGLKDEMFSVFEVALGALRGNAGSVLGADVAVLLSIGEAHIGRYDSLKELAFTKARIFECDVNSRAVINSGIPFFEEIKYFAQECGREVLTYGSENNDDFKFISFINSFLSFQYKGKDYTVYLNTYEKHDSLNFLACLCVLESLELDWENNLSEIYNGYIIEPGRGNLIEFKYKNNKDLIFIDHAYNSSPLSINSCLSSFDKNKMFKGRKIVFLSDMLELGEKSIELHKSILDSLDIYEDIDVFLVAGKFFDSSPSKSNNIFSFSSVSEGFDFLDSILNDGDIVLFKGANGTNLRTKMLNFVSGKL